MFDTWGGVLSPSMYREFSLRYLQRIAAELPRGERRERAPLILFGKGNAPYVEDWRRAARKASASTGRSNWATPRAARGGQVALQGNLDPATLYGSNPTRSAAKSAARSTATATATAARAKATCSTLATACRRT